MYHCNSNIKPKQISPILMIYFQIGTYTLALAAKEMNKPFYVVAESYKFARLYPLNQQDIPNQFKVQCLNLDKVS